MASLFLMLRCLDCPPTSYLHSWNQITTLVTIREVGRGAGSIFRPKEVTARVSAPLPVEPRPAWSDDPRFTAYEEFPLYHAAAGMLARTGLAPEAAGRLLSFTLWLLAGVLLCVLARRCGSRGTALAALMLFASSFPVLYYGRAIMSDIGMLALLLAALVCLQRAPAAAKTGALFAAAACLALAALFKSYAVLFAPVLFFSGAPVGRALRIRAAAVLLAAAPVVLWHLYAAVQPGVNEISSHSWHAKRDALLSFQLYSTMVTAWFRYLGDLGGGVVLAAAVVLTLRGAGGAARARIPWLRPYAMCFALYLVLTADKLPYHDYYFLPGVPLVFLPAGAALEAALHALAARRNGRALLGGAFVLFLLHYGMAVRSLLKAGAPQPDVARCAAAVARAVPQGAYIATLSDVSRFNSIEYYSGRMGFAVEGDALPLLRYSAVGARYLVVNLSREDRDRLQVWLTAELDAAAPLIRVADLVDAKGRERSCDIYELRPQGTARSAAASF